MASPTNKVRVMVADASGCCAKEVRAAATERPSPRAGHMHPRLMVSPAMTIEAIAIEVVLSMYANVTPKLRRPVQVFFSENE